MKRVIDLFGVPMDLGADRRGVDMGPSAIRIAGVVGRLRKLGHEVVDRGNVPCEAMEIAVPGDTSAKYEAEILASCQTLAARVAESVEAGHFPIVLGGDHSIAMGTVTGLSSVFRAREQKIGLIWFDAHGDMNTPTTSPSGNIHGMPLAALLGYGSDAFTGLGGFTPKVQPENCVLIGIRSIDGHEREMVKESGIHVFTMKEIDRLGMAEVVDQAIEFASRDTAGIHLSFDLDGLDPTVAPGVGTAVRGGVDYREAHLMMELLADCEKLVGLEMVELNAVIDERNRTGEVAVELILSALGRSIL